MLKEIKDFDIDTLEYVDTCLQEDRLRYEYMQRDIDAHRYFTTWLAIENKVLTFLEVQFMIRELIGQIKRSRDNGHE